MSQTLGRGLASLIPNKQNPGASSAGSQMKQVSSADAGTEKPDQFVKISAIQPNPDQPRKIFDETVLKELSDSIAKHGVLQPLLVQKVGENQYQLIAGERRLQASKLIGLDEVPVIIKKVTEQENLEIALVENIQRHDLNPIEEAKAFQRLHNDFDLSQSEIAKQVGKDRATIANTMRLIELPEEVKRGLVEGKITEGHARAILSEENKERQLAIYQEIINKKLTVRQTESLTRKVKVKSHTREVQEIDPVLKERISEIEKQVGSKIRVSQRGEKGTLTMNFFSGNDLEAILRRLEEGS